MLAAVNWQKVISCCESKTLKTSYSLLIFHEKILLLVNLFWTTVQWNEKKKIRA